MFTGPNGIYGNMVVLDHGLGLMSLYAHLSDIAVKVGQTVQKGEALGRSGETGLAGGRPSPLRAAGPRDLHEPDRVVGRPLAEGPDREAAGGRRHRAAGDHRRRDGGRRAPRPGRPAGSPAGPARPPLIGPSAGPHQGRAARPSRMTAATVPPTASRRKRAAATRGRAWKRPAGRAEAQPAPDGAEPHQAERQRHVGQPQGIHGRQCGPTPCDRARGPAPDRPVSGSPPSRGFPGFSPTL